MYEFCPPIFTLNRRRRPIPALVLHTISTSLTVTTHPEALNTYCLLSYGQYETPRSAPCRFDGPKFIPLTVNRSPPDVDSVCVALCTARISIIKGRSYAVIVLGAGADRYPRIPFIAVVHLRRRRPRKQLLTPSTALTPHTHLHTTAATCGPVIRANTWRRSALNRFAVKAGPAVYGPERELVVAIIRRNSLCCRVSTVSKPTKDDRDVPPANCCTTPRLRVNV